MTIRRVRLTDYERAQMKHDRRVDWLEAIIAGIVVIIFALLLIAILTPSGGVWIGP